MSKKIVLIGTILIAAGVVAFVVYNKKKKSLSIKNESLVEKSPVDSPDLPATAIAANPVVPGDFNAPPTTGPKGSSVQRVTASVGRLRTQVAQKTQPIQP